MNQNLLSKYARLIAVCGANVQKGQSVIINGPVTHSEFVTMVAQECYLLGAKSVSVRWECQPLSKLHYIHQSLETLSEVLPWEEAREKQTTIDLPATIYIVSDDPQGLAGVDMEKLQRAKVARWPILKPYREATRNLIQWTIAAVPSEPWAKMVFPGIPADEAVKKLWNAILSAVRITEDNDPIQAWAQHNANFASRCAWLNSQHFDRVVYQSANGTDFEVGLIPEGRWCGGGETTKNGLFFNPNLPTEEIFTSPMKGKAQGKLVSTKPLSYQGQLIEDFWFRFEDGRAVEWGAKSGAELLTHALSSDEGAAMLGELALIPCDSPINNSGILFYETLFDENASCHMALGSGFNDCIDGFMDKTDAQCKALGINESMIHIDFMIGAPDLAVTGYRGDTAVPIFRDGEWAF